VGYEGLMAVLLPQWIIGRLDQVQRRCGWGSIGAAPLFRCRAGVGGAALGPPPCSGAEQGWVEKHRLSVTNANCVSV